MLYLSNKPRLEDVVNRIGLQLRHGRCACPFHGGKDLNLSFNFKKQYWKCFVCGEGGDSIALYQKYFKVDFKAAITDLNCNVIRERDEATLYKERQKAALDQWLLTRRMALSHQRREHWLKGEKDAAAIYDYYLDMSDEEFYKHRKGVEILWQLIFSWTPSGPKLTKLTSTD